MLGSTPLLYLLSLGLVPCKQAHEDRAKHWLFVGMPPGLKAGEAKPDNDQKRDGERDNVAELS